MNYVKKSILSLALLFSVTAINASGMLDMLARANAAEEGANQGAGANQDNQEKPIVAGPSSFVNPVGPHIRQMVTNAYGEAFIGQPDPSAPGNDPEAEAIAQLQRTQAANPAPSAGPGPDRTNQTAQAMAALANGNGAAVNANANPAPASFAALGAGADVAPKAPVADASKTDVKVEAAKVADKSYLERFKDLGTKEKASIGLAGAAVVGTAGVVAYKKNTRFRNFVDSVGAGVKTNFNYYVADPVKSVYKGGISKATALKIAAGSAATAAIAWGAYKLTPQDKLDSIKAKAKELKDAANANRTKTVGIAAMATVAGAAVYKAYKYATGPKQQQWLVMLEVFSKDVLSDSKNAGLEKHLKAAVEKPLILNDVDFQKQLTKLQAETTQTIIKLWIDANPNALPQWQLCLIELGKVVAHNDATDKLINEALNDPNVLNNASFLKILNAPQKEMVQNIISLWKADNPNVELMKKQEVFGKFVKELTAFAAMLKTNKDQKAFVTVDKQFAHLTKEAKFAKDIIMLTSGVNPDFFELLTNDQRSKLYELEGLANLLS